MRGKTWRWSPVVLAVLLGVAFSQDSVVRGNSAPGSADTSQLAGGTSAPHAAAPAKTDNIASNTSDTPHDPTPTKGSSTPNGDSTNPAQSPPSMEESPNGPTEEIVPRRTLPVILNSSSPDLDRFVRREDINPVPNDYIIGEEDVLTITIWKEHDLSGTMVVRPDGKITVPLVGEINVVGMKPLQLQTLLEDKLKPFITVPQVSISVNQINSRKIYLIGQVVREGSFPINSSLTILQVLSAAGGLRDFAKKKKIYILRKQGDEEIRFPFDYDAAIHGRNREQNILVQPGDTIVVP